MQIKTITECVERDYCIVEKVTGSQRFLDRIGGMGITPNTRLKIIQNKKRQPILVYARNTMIAVNREEGKGIFVKGDK